MRLPAPGLIGITLSRSAPRTPPAREASDERPTRATHPSREAERAADGPPAPSHSREGERAADGPPAPSHSREGERAAAGHRDPPSPLAQRASSRRTSTSTPLSLKRASSDRGRSPSSPSPSERAAARGRSHAGRAAGAAGVTRTSTKPDPAHHPEEAGAGGSPATTRVARLPCRAPNDLLFGRSVRGTSGRVPRRRSGRSPGPRRTPIRGSPASAMHRSSDDPGEAGDPPITRTPPGACPRQLRLGYAPQLRRPWRSGRSPDYPDPAGRPARQLRLGHAPQLRRGWYISRRDEEAPEDRSRRIAPARRRAAARGVAPARHHRHLAGARRAAPAGPRLRRSLRRVAVGALRRSHAPADPLHARGRPDRSHRAHGARDDRARGLAAHRRPRRGRADHAPRPERAERLVVGARAEAAEPGAARGRAGEGRERVERARAPADHRDPRRGPPRRRRSRQRSRASRPPRARRPASP